MRERREMLGNGLLRQETERKMDDQLQAIEVRLKETANKITRSKMAIASLKRDLAQEFNWPAEELLR